MNIKIPVEEYKELLEAKAFADDIGNMLQIRIDRSDNGLVNQTDFGHDAIMPQVFEAI